MAHDAAPPPDAPAPAYPDGEPAYPGEEPNYPGEAPSYPGNEPSYPGEEPSYRGEEPTYPGEERSHPGEEPSHSADEPPYPGTSPAYPGEEPARSADVPANLVVPPVPLLPVAPIPPPPTHPPISAALDDLELQSGRFHLRARQRGVDGAAVAQLVATLPAAFISLVVVALAGSMVDPPVGVLAGLGWLGSGLLVFRPSVEGLIARRLGMRLPEPAEAERLAVVWEQVTRRAGVRPGTYRLWVQDRAELNATATAGHIVGVTRHSLDRLSNAQLAAVLAHELGHHVGGHTWAGLLADWYSLPARTLARLTFRLASALLASRNPAGVGCGGCLVLTTPFVLIDVLYVEGLWWLFLPAALAPLFVTLLKRRAERRADDYAVGLGFGPDLAAVVLQEQQRRRTSGSAARPRPHPPVGSPPFSAQPSTRTPGPAAAPPPPTPHTDLDARLRQLQDRLGNGGSDGG